MKKLIIFLLCITLSPFTAFAIALSSITNNPAQYKKVHKDENWSTYIDKDSIKPIRHAPPFYTIQGTIYDVSNDNKLIRESILVVDYNYAYSINSFIRKDNIWDSTFSLYDTKEQTINKLTTKFDQKIMKNTGMIASETYAKMWTSNEKKATPLSAEHDFLIKFATSKYYVANYLFYHCYHEPFQTTKF